MESKSIKFVVYPSSHSAGSLEVADAMRQVLDLLKLLGKAGAGDESVNQVISWRLISASTNSPLTIVAGPESANMEHLAEVRGMHEARQLVVGMNQLLAGAALPDWIDDGFRKTVSGVFNRNLNGIGRTDFIVEDEDLEFSINPVSASVGLAYLRKLDRVVSGPKVDWKHKEYGSVEGNFLNAGTWRGKPSVKIKSRLTGETISCVFRDPDPHARQQTIDEVWNGNRVIVIGTLVYNANGDIDIVYADDMTIVKKVELSVRDVHDPNFSNGLTPSEHLAAVWGGRG